MKEIQLNNLKYFCNEIYFTSISLSKCVVIDSTKRNNPSLRLTLYNYSRDAPRRDLLPLIAILRACLEF